MNARTSELERAFQLATSGKHLTVDEIRKRLVKEGYSNNQVSGRQLIAQLRALIKAAHSGGKVRCDS